MRRSNAAWMLWAAAATLVPGFETPAAAPPANSACLECHAVDGHRPADAEPDGTSLYVADWEASVHAALACVDCHAEATAPHEEPLAAARCDACHDAETRAYARGPHGLLAAAGDARAPGCATCHDPHGVRPADDPQSLLHRSHGARTCTGCHADGGRAANGAQTVPHPASSYERGVHAQAITAGNLRAATCGDCHDSHGVLRAQDPASPVYRRNIPATCGNCHASESEDYAAGVHGAAVARGSTGSPVCNTCHGEHAVLALGEPGRTTVVASETCESCHANPVLVRRFDLPQGAVSSYEDSYHGRAARGGLAQAAGCASCHGVHRILPKSDPASSIHPQNLVATCGVCHPGATAQFAASYAHAPRRGATVEDRAAAIVRSIYLWIIGIVIGGMVLHNAVLAAHDVRLRWQRHRARATHVRFVRGEVRQHFVLLLAFTLLAITGFALRYPDMGWVRLLSLDEAERKLLHRVAAVGFLGVSAFHLVYMFTRRGREQIRHMLPRLDDVRDAGANMAYHLGRRLRRPDFGRFRYIEKAEYWALVWGTVIMGVTGFMLWFPEHLAGPSWMVRVAEAIHWYEAWLAVLAIVVWHFYFVLLRPGITGSFTAITGRMDPEELAHEHPAEYAQQYGAHLRRDKVETSTGDVHVRSPGADPGACEDDGAASGQDRRSADEGAS